MGLELEREQLWMLRRLMNEGATRTDGLSLKPNR